MSRFREYYIIFFIRLKNWCIISAKNPSLLALFWLGPISRQIWSGDNFGFFIGVFLFCAAPRQLQEITVRNYIFHSCLNKKRKLIWLTDLNGLHTKQCIFSNNEKVHFYCLRNRFPDTWIASYLKLLSQKLFLGKLSLCLKYEGIPVLRIHVNFIVVTILRNWVTQIECKQKKGKCLNKSFLGKERNNWETDKEANNKFVPHAHISRRSSLCTGNVFAKKRRRVKINPFSGYMPKTWLSV